MKPRTKKSASSGISDTVLEKVSAMIPGFHGFFKKMEGSKTFGARVSGIRKEIERRFGSAKK